MSSHDVPETVVRRYTDNGCEVTTVVAGPVGAQHVLYGTVTRDGTLVGSYYCTDRVRQSGWRVVTADGDHLSFDGATVNLNHEGDAVYVLTTLTGNNQHKGRTAAMRHHMSPRR